jgi:hypothetical protein
VAPAGLVGEALIVGVGTGLGAVGYLVAGHFLKIEELTMLRDLVRRKLVRPA